MPIPHVVMPDEVAAAGWICERCGEPFEPGDLAYGEFTGMIGPVPVESNWMCLPCYYAHAHDGP